MPPGSIEQRVLECLDGSYGIRGTLQRLPGENLNYLLTTAEGVRQVVKIVDDHMPPEVVEMEFEAMEYAISAGFSLELPRIVQNKHKKIETGIIIHKNELNRLRVLSFIDGINLDSMSDISNYLLKSVGISLAEYNLAMEGFNHPAANRSHRWNLVEAGQHRDKIDLVEDPGKQALLAWGFDAWKKSENRLKSLPWQFIHGDMNPENILVRGNEVTGLVDFGDACFNPVVCDLAICLTYIMMNCENPQQATATVTRAYHETRPLNEAEFSVILPLVCGRLATTIAISTARRKIDPDNPNWFGTEEPAWRLLSKLRDISEVHDGGMGTFLQRYG
jgi:Ser/Thr protein kinase RdoA (MazF antagonist)